MESEGPASLSYSLDYKYLLKSTIVDEFFTVNLYFIKILEVDIVYDRNCMYIKKNLI